MCHVLCIISTKKVMFGYQIGLHAMTVVNDKEINDQQYVLFLLLQTNYTNYIIHFSSEELCMKSHMQFSRLWRFDHYWIFNFLSCAHEKTWDYIYMYILVLCTRLSTSCYRLNNILTLKIHWVEPDWTSNELVHPLSGVFAA